MAGDQGRDLHELTLGEDSDGTACGAENDNWRADADLSVPENFVRIADGPKLQIDVEATYGSEEQFLRVAPAELRAQLHLPTDATSEQVFRKMAKDMFRMFPEASPQLQREALSGLGLQRSDLIGRMASESKVFEALVNRDKRELGLPAGATFLELETAMHRQFYWQMKDGTVPIDYD